MIDKTVFKSAVAMAFATVLLTGCGSADKDDDLTAMDVYGAEDSVQVNAADDAAALDAASYQDDVEAAGLDTIFYFDFDKSELRVDVRAALDEHAAYLRNKNGIIRLEGHGDERGTREYNLALGERRARAIANYLAIQGVPNSQIETISYGEEKPAAMGHSEAAWSKNRRVELVYVD